MSLITRDTYSLTFEPLQFGATIGFRPAGDPPVSVLASGPTESLRWKAKLHSDYTVRLSTGRELDEIDGSVTVRVGTETISGGASYGEFGVKLGVLHWYEGSPDLDEGYSVSVNVSPAVFDRCYQLMLSGRVPTITIHVEKSVHDSDKDGTAIKYGWEPDGSGKEWNNKDFPYLDVAWYEFAQPINDQKEPFDLAAANDSRPVTTKQLGTWLAEIKAQIQQISYFLWVALAALVISRLF